MAQRVVIIGGSIAGLGAALGLARRGHMVTVLERDPEPGTRDTEEAFRTWERRGVPQNRQPHGFLAPVRNLLTQYAPDVVVNMLAHGVQDWNVMDMAPPEAREPDDEMFAGLLVRRIPFELLLRQAVEAEPYVELHSNTPVAGLLFSDDESRIPTVTGVRLEDGTELDADVVVDAGGRRTPVPGWLSDRDVTIPQDTQDCELHYFGRYYRQLPQSQLDATQIVGMAGDLGYLMYGGFNGDDRTLAFFIGAAPWDDELRALRHNAVWEAIAAEMPAVAPWISATDFEPITDVQFMTGHHNAYRHYVVDGEPVVLGVLPIGDALCTTNPAFGWGSSLALTYAFAAVEAIDAHPADPAARVVNYISSVEAKATAAYTDSAAQDRIRTYRWKGELIPDEDKEAATQQDLILNGLNPAMRRDLSVLRAMLRRIHLIDPPDAVFENEQVIRVATGVAEWRAANLAGRKLGPTREEASAIIQGAAGGSST